MRKINLSLFRFSNQFQMVEAMLQYGTKFGCFFWKNLFIELKKQHHFNGDPQILPS